MFEYKRVSEEIKVIGKTAYATRIMNAEYSGAGWELRTRVVDNMDGSAEFGEPTYYRDYFAGYQEIKNYAFTTGLDGYQVRIIKR